MPWEIGNAFSAMFKRNRITLAQAQDALRLFASLPIRQVAISIPDAVDLAAQLGIYAYDAYMIRCAQETASPLLTLDSALRHHATRVGVQVIEVTP
jgi:predicted nucleic acid-binding protein